MVLLIGQGTTYRPINDGEIEDPELIYTAFNEYASDSQQLVKVSSETVKKSLRNLATRNETRRTGRTVCESTRVCRHGARG